MKEHAIQNTIRNELAGKLLLWRVNVGQAWTGDAKRLPDGSLLIRNPRPFTTGLPAGFSDLFGIKSVKITPDMVGQTIGVFVAGECKTAKGKPTEQQTAFLSAVNRAGGVGDVWRSPDDALATLERIGGKEDGEN